MVSKKSLTNLNKGGNHNPGGRPKGPSLIKELKQYYRDNPDKLKEVIESLHKNATQNKSGATAIALVKEFLDGKTPDRLQLDNDLNINISLT